MICLNVLFSCTGIPCWKPIWLHGEYFTRGEDQLLRKESRRVPEKWGHVRQDRAHFHSWCRLLAILSPLHHFRVYYVNCTTNAHSLCLHIESNLRMRRISFRYSVRVLVLTASLQSASCVAINEKCRSSYRQRYIIGVCLCITPLRFRLILISLSRWYVGDGNYILWGCWSSN